MRRRLAVLAVAITLLVVLAFLVPLGLTLRTLARDRALTSAERDANALVPVLAVTVEPARLDPAIAATEAGADGRLTVFLADGRTAGAAAVADAAVALARTGRAFSAGTDTGAQVLHPVADGTGGMSVVRVIVPESQLHHRVWPAWVLLALLGLGLIGIAVLVADRLARSATRPMQDLAAAARDLSSGDMDVRVTPQGPPEVAEFGRTFNRLADRINALVVAEREVVADLSHRLRTPLTALRLEIDAVRDPESARRLEEVVGELEITVDQVIRSARRPVRHSVVPLVDVLAVAKSRTAFWAPLADDQGRDWSLDGAADGPVIVAAEVDDLEAALDALIDNVFAHTGEGTAFRVRVEGTEDNAVRLVVEDDGPGLAGPDVVTRGASTVGSTGLGLDIARRTAEAAGGALRLGSSDGGGARVVLELPRSLDG